MVFGDNLSWPKDVLSEYVNNGHKSGKGCSMQLIVTRK